MEQCEDIHHTLGMNDLYNLRKKTIEQIFGTAKENHEFRYTQMFGNDCWVYLYVYELKKLAKMKQRMRGLET